MAYSLFDQAVPNGTQVGSAFATSAKANILNLRDAIVWGLVPHTSGFSYAQAGGTAAEPATITVSMGNEKTILNLTWSSGFITQMVTKYLVSAGGTTETASTATVTYDGNGDLTSITGAAMGMVAKLLPLLGKYKAIKTAFDAHYAATAGASAHGIGSCALQNANNVFFTGGSMLGVPIGSPTSSILAPVNATYVRENFTQLTAITAAGVTRTVDLAAAGIQEIAVSGTSSTAHSVLSISGMSTSYNRACAVYLIITVASGTQYLDWANATGWVGQSQGSVDAGTHLFCITQRIRASDANSMVMLNYLGKLV